jgi:hypothetical protein
MNHATVKSLCVYLQVSQYVLCHPGQSYQVAEILAKKLKRGQGKKRWLEEFVAEFYQK